MRLHETANLDLLTMDTLTGLRDEMVEIWEHETVRTVRLNDSTPNEKVSGRSPKLVIDDDKSTQVFISKARSKDDLLNQIIGQANR